MRALVLAPALIVAAAFAACAQQLDAPDVTQEAQPEAHVLRNGDGDGIALTFDVGDGPGRVTEILGALREANVRASFVVTGAWAEANIELLRAIAADGHQIINGGRSGASWTGASTGTPALTEQERAIELSRTETSVFRLTNRSTRPFCRPPHGDIDASVERDAAAAGYSTIVLWSFDATAIGNTNAEAFAARAVEAATPGAIIRMSTDRDDHGAALSLIIQTLRDRGLTLQTIDEIAPQ